MKVLYCWRCDREIPMLDEAEFAEVSTVLRECIEKVKGERREQDSKLKTVDVAARCQPAFDLFEKLTGFRETNPNAIWHHRISKYGPPCTNCGKPLRTPEVSSCAECGAKKARRVLTARRQFLFSATYVILCLMLGTLGNRLQSEGRQSLTGIMFVVTWFGMILVSNPLLLYWDCRRKGIAYRNYALAVIVMPPWIVSLYLARTYGAWAGILIPVYFFILLGLVVVPFH